MNQGKTASRLALLLPLTLLLLPIGAVRASHMGGPSILVDPSSIVDGMTVPAGTVLPGYTFSVNVVADEVGTFNAYDISLRYGTTILTATAVTLLSVQGQSFAEAIPTVLDDSTGTIRVAAGISGGGTVTVLARDPLFRIDFVVEGFGTSPLDVANDKVVLGGDSILHGTQDGMVTTFPEPPVTRSALIRRQAWPGTFHLDISNTGGQLALFALVKNTHPTNTAPFVKVVFAVSIGGLVTPVESNSISLMPGEIGQVRGTATISTPGVYSVVAVPFTSAENLVFFQGENSKSFIFRAAD